jgi:phage gpG-like protein
MTLMLATGIKLVLADGELSKIRASLMPNRQKMLPVSKLLREQVDQRFETEGSSGGKPWKKPKWIEAIGKPDNRRLLQGRTGGLRQSYDTTTTDDSAAVHSDSMIGAVHQQGTRKYDGRLPDIKPVRAGALFIPLTERAFLSRPVTAMGITRRQAEDGGDLIRGRLVRGVLTPPDADFILLRVVGIPPREQLPASIRESNKQTDLLVRTLAGET